MTDTLEKISAEMRGCIADAKEHGHVDRDDWEEWTDDWATRLEALARPSDELAQARKERDVFERAAVQLQRQQATVPAGALLVRMTCPDCGAAMEPREDAFACPKCSTYCGGPDGKAPRVSPVHGAQPQSAPVHEVELLQEEGCNLLPELRAVGSDVPGFDGWRWVRVPVHGTPPEVEAAKIGYMAGHNDTVEGCYGDPGEVAQDICREMGGEGAAPERVMAPGEIWVQARNHESLLVQYGEPTEDQWPPSPSTGWRKHLVHGTPAPDSDVRLCDRTAGYAGYLCAKCDTVKRGQPFLVCDDCHPPAQDAMRGNWVRYSGSDAIVYGAQYEPPGDARQDADRRNGVYWTRLLVHGAPAECEKCSNWGWGICTASSDTRILPDHKPGDKCDTYNAKAPPSAPEAVECHTCEKPLTWEHLHANWHHACNSITILEGQLEKANEKIAELEAHHVASFAEWQTTTAKTGDEWEGRLRNAHAQRDAAIARAEGALSDRDAARADKRIARDMLIRATLVEADTLCRAASDAVDFIYAARVKAGEVRTETNAPAQDNGECGGCGRCTECLADGYARDPAKLDALAQGACRVCGTLTATKCTNTKGHRFAVAWICPDHVSDDGACKLCHNYGFRTDGAQ